MLDGEEDDSDGQEDGGCLEGVGPVEQGGDARGGIGLVTRGFSLNRAAHHDESFRFVSAAGKIKSGRKEVNKYFEEFSFEDL